jgi:hypothetical protein
MKPPLHKSKAIIFTRCIIRRAVENPRHSACATAKLCDLDWSNWWTDTSFKQNYLHVAHKDSETSHRVYCRGNICPRLGMCNGKLTWIYYRKP